MSKEIEARKVTSFRRVINKLLQILARKEIFPGNFRARLHKMRGVQFDDVGSVFFGDNIIIDGIYPKNVRIGKRCIITSGVKILTHFLDTDKLSDDDGYYFRFYQGKVVIEEDVFIGFNVVIAKPVTIGKGSIIGANSVITKDVPPGSVMTGSPAKLMKQFNKIPCQPEE